MDLEDIEKDSGKLLKRVRKIEKDSKSTRNVFKKGDVLYSKLRTYLNKVLIADQKGYCTTEILPLDFNGFVVPEYARYVLMSNYFLDYTAECCYGVKMPRLGTYDGENAPFPLPPLNEQKRISSKINSLFVLIDRINENQLSLEQFVNQTKSKVLELAIKGKLVPQNPEDEPASTLLERLGIKKASSDTSHYPFKIPKSWEWIELNSVLEYEQPTKYIVKSTEYSDTYSIPVLTAGKSFIIGYTNEKEGVYKDLPVIIFDDFTTSSKYVDFEFKVKSSAMKILRARKDIANIKYIAFFISITRLAGNTHKRYWISEYSKIKIPLPPLAEQQRIVEKIEDTFKTLDRILDSLKAIN